MADLDAIRHRLNAATPGPWHGEHEVYQGRELPCVSQGDYGWVCAGEHAPAYDVDSDQGRADAEFIAHSREDVEVLLAEVARLRRLVAVPVGDHLREAGGTCGHCGSWHSPQEWARLEDRLDEEGRRGR